MANVNFNLPGGLKGNPARMMVGLVGGVLVLMIFFGSCTTYIPPNQVGIKESRFIPPTGILSGEMKGGKVKFLLPGQTIHLFPKDIQVLDLTGDRSEAGHSRREQMNHRMEPAVQINTSDGSQVMVDVTVIYKIENADLVIQQAGPGRLFENNAVIPKTISALKKNLGEMVAEDFYDVHKREPKVKAAHEQISRELKEKGITVEHVMVRQYYYNQLYEQQIEEKKIQDQLKFTRVSEAEAAKELAKLQEIVATGKATVAVERQKGQAEITKIQAEADSYRRKRHAEADLQVQLATAKGTELENAAYQGAGSENLVGMEMAEVYRGLDVIVVPAGGKGGVNPLDLEQALRMFDVK